MNEGWVCTKCGKSLAPWVKECWCTFKHIPLCPSIWTFRFLSPDIPQTGDPLPENNHTTC